MPPFCLCKPFSSQGCPGILFRIPGYALHDKYLQRQLGVGTLVSSSGRRPNDKPWVNRGLCSPIGLKNRISFVRACEVSFRRFVFGSLESVLVGCLLRGSTRRRPVPLGPAPLRPTAVRRLDPTRPFCVRVSGSTINLKKLSNPKPGHTPGGSVRGGACRDGGAGRGRAAQDADGIVRQGENSPFYPPDDGRMTSWVCLWKHEQRKPYINRWGNKTRG